jgi:type III restriction enzyme
VSTPVVIENPVINSAFSEPTRHFRFSDDGITDEIVESRRVSAYFVPIAQPKKKGKQMVFDTEWTQDRIEENKFINDVRKRVSDWRAGGHAGVTKTTRMLLDHWTGPDRERRLFFCQIEALETAVFLTEIAPKTGAAWIDNHLQAENERANPALFRIAIKMATGSGKTVVMAMLIAWQALNKFADPKDKRFSDTFLIVTPGITIRDRLRVLLPNDPDNYYRSMDVVPRELQSELNRATVLVTNFHTFLPREKTPASTLGKAILRGRGASDQSPFTETPDEMVRRACRALGNKKKIVVINDEAHHCYRRKPPEEVDEAAGGVLTDRLAGDDRKEAQDREEEARVWISGLEAVKTKIGIRAIYDLSATPFFLRGSGYPEGTLFPWVVSDFSLIDAIECGIVKVPRVPVADDAMTGALPTYRELWKHIRDKLPKKGRKTEDVSGGGPPKLPAELEGALYSLYGNYEKSFKLWEEMRDAHLAAGDGSDASYLTPPVFIVVCNNTNVSKLVYDWISGWEAPVAEGMTAIAPGNLTLFSNVRAFAAGQNAWSDRPKAILVDSKQLESGEAMSPEFKKIAAAEIVEFKAEYRERFPGRSTEDLTDEDLLREVMNTIGKPGKLGEQIRCVVSVSMLTEGWDANTVTHILGVRAFSTQLLCEQVVGRGLRRMTYVPNADDMFDPQYAEVYGVPFSFIPCAGQAVPQPPRVPTRVRALEERIACEITFPRLQGYRYELPTERLTAQFTDDSRMALSTQDIPTKVENAPIVGETVIHDLDDLKARRPQQVAFLLAKLVYETYFVSDDGDNKPWLFPQILEIAQRWLDECLVCKDDCFPQLLLLIEFAHNAADKIYRAIVEGEAGEKRLMPILQPYDTEGSTRYVDFDTTRAVMPTDPEKCHVSHVVCDTDSWEQKMAQTLEDMPEVVRYVKNHNLGFFVPYTFNGEEHRYIPDFIVRLRAGDASLESEPLNLIIEVTGERKKEKAAKVETARTLWMPAVNNHGGFGRWAFLEISDPWDAKNTIRAHLAVPVEG